MKYLLLFAIALNLVACADTEPNATQNNQAPNIIDASDAGSSPIDPESISRLGEACGPSTEKLCASGLSCQFEGMQQGEGLCLPVVVNPDLECDETQDPVCGLIGTNKNGYLNECFARRFGAVVLNEGFCKNDETIKNNCDARAYSLGNCQESFTGARFNQNSDECEAVTLVGCSADIPFESFESCQSSCS
jgi:hypothetical protein